MPRLDAFFPCVNRHFARRSGLISDDHTTAATASDGSSVLRPDFLLSESTLKYKHYSPNVRLKGGCCIFIWFTQHLYKNAHRLSYLSTLNIAMFYISVMLWGTYFVRMKIIVRILRCPLSCLRLMLINGRLATLRIEIKHTQPVVDAKFVMP